MDATLPAENTVLVRVLSLEADQLFSAFPFPESLGRQWAMENMHMSVVWTLHTELLQSSFFPYSKQEKCRPGTFCLLQWHTARFPAIQAQGLTTARSTEARLSLESAYGSRVMGGGARVSFLGKAAAGAQARQWLRASRLRCYSAGHCSTSLSREIHSCSWSAQQDLND